MNMNMGTSTMAMGASATEVAASATSSAMSMSMGGGSCKISMLWNWYTVNACFISETWHVTSRSMFAGSCIGVILLVVSLEFLRRASKEYDQYILRQYQRLFLSTFLPSSSNSPAKSVVPAVSQSKEANLFPDQNRGDVNTNEIVAIPPFRPNLLQQMVRATLHMMQFAAAYFIMLLAMYFNGYIIICIIIGAWIGAFIFSWETVDLSAPGDAKQETTYCCG